MMCGNTYIKSKLRYESLKTLNHTHTHTHTYIERGVGTSFYFDKVNVGERKLCTIVMYEKQ
mgnify:CR=1 FL=1